MRLLIVRHGETEGNLGSILAGPEDSLNSNGKAQAQALSESLKNERIEAIFSSPYSRARETAEAIAKNHQDAQFIVDNDLREMELGSYLNKKYDEVDWEKMPPDVEPRTSTYARAKKAIERALAKYPAGTVVFVSHNAMNKAAIRFLRGWDANDRKPIPQDNTAVTIFEVSEKGNKEILFNSTKHLETMPKG